jgi:hypothetical protein
MIDSAQDLEIEPEEARISCKDSTRSISFHYVQATLANESSFELSSLKTSYGQNNDIDIPIRWSSTETAHKDEGFLYNLFKVWFETWPSDKRWDWLFYGFREADLSFSTSVWR